MSEVAPLPVLGVRGGATDREGGFEGSSPYAFSITGATNSLAYHAATHLFTLNVTPGNFGTATLALSLALIPALQIAAGTTGQFQLLWPAAAVGYILEETTNLTPPVVWYPTPAAVNSTNGQNVVTITNVKTSTFYRLSQ